MSLVVKWHGWPFAVRRQDRYSVQLNLGVTGDGSVAYND